MNKILFSGIIALSMLTAFGQNGGKDTEVLKGLQEIVLDNDQLFVVDFLVGEFEDNNVSDDTLRITTSSSVFANTPTLKHYQLSESVSEEQSQIHLFSDVIAMDSAQAVQSQSLSEFEKIGTGSFRNEEVSSFNATSKEYAGKIELTWTEYPGASGYVILRRNVTLGEQLASKPSAYHVIESGITTSWSDFSVLNGAEYEYFIFAYNTRDEKNRFVSAAARAIGQIDRMQFLVYNGNEEVVSIFWSYDNSVLQGRELEAVSEQINEGEVYSKEIFISDYNIGNSRLQFNTIDLDGSGSEGVYVTIPKQPSYQPFTLEFWVNVGSLSDAPNRFLSDDANNSYIRIKKNQLISSVNGVEERVDFGFESNKWTHLAFSSDGTRVQVIINGQEAGDFGTPQHFPFIFGAGEGISSLPTLNTSMRLGLIRSWEVNRSVNQIKQDLYDLYEDIDVANLKNQWTIPGGLTQTSIAGLVPGGGTMDILKSSGYQGSLNSSKAYIFDRSEISNIHKFRTSTLEDRYEFTVYEVGSGKRAIGSFGTPAPFKSVENLIKVSYNPDTLGRVHLNYLTGSVFPEEYTIMRSLGEDTVEIASGLVPDKIDRAGRYNEDKSLDLTPHLAELTNRPSLNSSYSFYLKLSPYDNKADDQVLIDLGSLQLIATNENKLYLGSEFIYTIKDESWKSIHVSIRELPLDNEVRIYLDGSLIASQSIPNNDLGNVFTLDRFQINGSKTYPFELGYMAYKTDSTSFQQAVESSGLIPDIREGWQIFYHTGKDTLVTRRLKGAFDFENLIQDEIVVSGSFDGVKNPQLNFFNEGNLYTSFHYVDTYSAFDPSRIMDNRTYSYEIRPIYSETFGDRKFRVSDHFQSPDLGLELTFIPEQEATMVKWDQDLLSQHNYDSVAIYRDNELINYVFKDSLMIDSLMPFGATHRYTIRPIQNGEAALEALDSIAISPNGYVEGKLVSLRGDFIVPNTSFSLVGESGTLNFTSDSIGGFNQSGIEYGIGETFKSIRKEGGSIMINKSHPISKNNFIKTEKLYQTKRVSNLIDEKKISYHVEPGRDYYTFEIPLKELDTAIYEYFLNIYVNQQLVSVIHNSNLFYDSLSSAAENEYTFKLYYFENENRIIYDEFDKGSILNADNYTVTDITAQVNNNKWVPEISWTYPSTDRVDGFQVFRLHGSEEEYVQQVSLSDDVTDYLVLDKEGIPRTLYRYRVVPFYDRDTTVYLQEEAAVSSNLLYPDWKERIKVSIESVKNEIRVDISQESLENLPFDGFIIKNDDQVIKSFSKENYTSYTADSTNYTFEFSTYLVDKYEPELFLYKNVRHTQFEELFAVGETIKFENVSIDGFQAVNKNESEDQHFMLVSWDKPEVQPEFYRVYVTDNKSTASANPIEILNGSATNFAYDASSRTDDKQTTWHLTITAGYAHNGVTEDYEIGYERYRFKENKGDTIAYPSDFRASLDATDRVALSWEYPDYGLASFEIFRDGQYLTTLPTYQRSFIDEDADSPGQYYSYQIRTVYKGETSKYVNTVGRLRSRIQLFGLVYDINGNPMPFTAISVNNTHTQTDSLGYYELDEKDFAYNEKIDVTAITYKAGSSQRVEKIESLVADKDGAYRIDFRFDHPHYQYVQKNELAEVKALSARTNVFNHEIRLNWAASTALYSLFEIYRGVSKIGEVDGSSLLTFTDDDVVPGLPYTYTIRPVYFDRNGTRIEESLLESDTIKVVLDKLQPVQFLEATTFEEDGQVLLDWIHDYGNVDGYVIERNGSTFASIDTLGFYDNQGVPGEEYTYVVRPYVNKGGTYHFAEALTRLSVIFPPVAPVKNLTAVASEDGFEVDLSWNYPTTVRNLKGVQIEREDDIIGSADYPTTTFTDSRGFPNTLTVYKVLTISEDPNDDQVSYLSKPAYDTVWYPTLRPVENIQFTSQENTLNVSWEYNGLGADDFILSIKEEGETDSLVVYVPYDESLHSYDFDIINQIPGSRLIIGLQAQKRLSGENYRSDREVRNAIFPSLPIANLSGDYADSLYYKISWDYSSFSIDRFKMLVNGVWEFELSPGARAFTYPINLADFSNGGDTDFTTFSLTAIKTINDSTNHEETFAPITLSQPLNRSSYLGRKVSAADNSNSDQRISWSSPISLSSSVDRWVVYRNKEEITSVPYSTSETSYEIFDYSALPGVEYLYEVHGYKGSALGKILIPDLGSTKGKAGVITAVNSVVGSSPVKDIPFTLIGAFGEGYYFHRDTTDANGLLEISELPFRKADGARINYELKSVLPEDYFDGASSFDFQIGGASQNKVLPNLWYNRSNTVKGRVKYVGCSACGIDSINMELRIFTQPDRNPNSQLEIKPPIQTDEYGNFSFAVPQKGNFYYELKLQWDTAETNGSKHNFIRYDTTFSTADFDEAGVFDVDFLDQNLFPLNIAVSDGCSSSLGDYEFKVRVRDVEGGDLYDSVFYTNPNGELLVSVPPFNYNVEVIGVRQPDAFSTLVSDFFRSRPYKFFYETNLYEYISLQNEDDTFDAISWMQSLYAEQEEFIFLRGPKINTSDFDSQNSCDVLVLNGDERQSHTVRFVVDDNGCKLDDGYIIVKNSGAAKPVTVSGAVEFTSLDQISDETIEQLAVQSENGSFFYEFIADNPNLVAPYKHLVEVFYLDKSLNIITSESFEYVVTGSRLVDGKDVFVDPSTNGGNDNLNIPLYVLRDPPGDQSYAYLEEGSEFSLSLNTTTNKDFGGAVTSTSEFESFVLTNSDTQWKIDYEDKKVSKQTIKFKTTKKISTSPTSPLSTNLEGYLDGKDADVILGMGIAYQYGIKDNLTWNENTCTFEKFQSYDIAADEIRTTWVYTRSMIDQTIKYYDSLLALPEIVEANFDLNDVTSSDGEIAANNNGLDLRAIIQQSRDGWIEVVRYVDYEANPICQLISEYNDLILGSSIGEIAEEIASFTRLVTKGQIDLNNGEIDDLTDELEGDIIYYLENVNSFIQKVQGLDANICDSVNPLEVGGFTQQFYDEFSEAYGSFAKLKMIRAYNRELTEIAAITPLDTLLNSEDYALNPALLTNSALAGGFAVRNTFSWDVKAFKAQLTDDLYNKAFFRYGSAAPGFDALRKELIKLTPSATSPGEAARLRKAEISKLIKKGKIKNFVSDVNYSKAVTDAKKASKAALNAKYASTRVGKTIGKNNARRISSIFKLKNFVTSVGTIGFDIALTVGHIYMSGRTYDFLRDYYTEDVRLLTGWREADFSNLFGYEASQNVTFSGGSRLEEQITYNESDELTSEGYWASSLNTSIEVGVGYENDIWTGIAAGTEARTGDGKISGTLDINERVQQRLGNTEFRSRSYTVGYVLSDNDDGDHFNTYILNNVQVDNSAKVAPVFHLVGGRSSDPYEEGTISRDKPTLQFVDEEGNQYETIQTNLDPNVSTVLPLQIGSGNLFQEGRSVAVTIVPNSNTSGAQLLLSNAEIFVGRSNDYFIPANQEFVYTNLLIDAKEGIYDYDDLALVVRPKGVKDDFFAEGADVFDTLAFELHYRKPVSNIRISEGDGPWLINAGKNGDRNDNFIFRIEGYDPENRASGLSHIELEYKGTDEGQFDWKEMIGTHGSNKLTLDTLVQFFENNIRTYNEPTYLYEWDLVNNPEIIDGDYQVRATAFDENGLQRVSNVYTGTIDRSRPEVLGIPEPADQIFSLGDAISVSFNEGINSDYFDAHGSVWLEVHRSDSTIKYFETIEETGIDVVSTDQGVTITLDYDIPQFNDGKKVEIFVTGIKDLFGNFTEKDTISWTFTLDYYKQAPSSIRLASPIDWTYTSVDDMGAEVTDTIDFVITDYDVFQKSSALAKVDLEVNRNGSGSWKTVASVTIEELLQDFDSLENPSAVPEFVLRWALNDPGYIVSDGSYQVRALAYGENAQYSISNSSNGIIDRTKPQLEGIPSPSDQILSRGEFVQFNFTEAIDFESGLLSTEVISNGDAIPPQVELISDEDTIIVKNYELQYAANSVTIVFEDDFIRQFPSEDSISVLIDGVKDLVGNEASTFQSKFITDYFSIPASSIAIVDNGQWLINRFSDPELPIIFKDYDLYESKSWLDSVVLEYRKLQNHDSTKHTWTKIQKLAREELQDRFESHANLGDTPIDTVNWYNHLIPDGTYEIRAVVYGGNSFTISGYWVGKIDRTPPRVFGRPEPVDEVLSFGDKATINFTENINYSESGTEELENRTRIYSSEGDFGFSDYEIRATGSSIEILISNEIDPEFYGDTVYVEIEGIEDLVGNPLYEKLDWSFRIEPFGHRPSPVSLTSPGNFVVNKETLSPIQFTVEEYDVYQYVYSLDALVLQYKRSEEGDDAWKVADQLDIAELVSNYEDRLIEDPNAFPIDYLYLDHETLKIADGNYEVRVQSLFEGKSAYSNVVGGIIDRLEPVILSYSPFDGVFSRGDAVGVAFNEDIDVQSPLNIVVLGHEDKSYFTYQLAKSEVVLTPTDEFDNDLSNLDGETFAIDLTGVKDLAGNEINKATLSFLIDFYRKAASPVRIKTPSSFVATQNLTSQKVRLVIDQFELNNSDYALDYVELQYRITGTNGWNTFHTFTRQDLENQNSGSGSLEASYDWIIDERIADGLFEVRAVSFGDGETDHSNIVSGIVDRSSPELESFEPIDGVFNEGDQIVFTFNEPLFRNQLVQVLLKDANGNRLPDLFANIQSSNTITIQPILSLASFDGLEIFIELSGIYDQYGNELVDGVERSFRVDYFSKPPSPVRLKSSDFLVSESSGSALNLTVDGYDLYEFEHALTQLVLEIRETSGINDWIGIDSVSRDELVELHYDPEKEPAYTFELETSELNEGLYEIRIVSHGNDQFDYSNTIHGTVDRISPTITFEPIDGFYSINDRLGFQTNESINVNYPVGVEVRTIGGSNLTNLFTKVVSDNAVELIIKNYQSLSDYDGQELMLAITSDVQDLAGNVYSGSNIHLFEVDYQRQDISPYDVVSPAGEVVINKLADKQIDFTIQGYELGNQYKLDKVALLVKYPDNLGEWILVDQKLRSELNPAIGDQQTQDILSWLVEDSDPEGVYSLQFRSYGGNQFNIEHSTSAFVDRVSPELVSFDPADGIYGRSDQVRFTFSETLLESELVQVDLKDGLGGTVPEDRYQVLQTSETISIIPTTDFSDYDGQTLTINLSNIVDNFHNELTDGVTKSIIVDHFRKSPSPVRIKTPGNLVINRFSDSTVELVVDGYDVFEVDHALDSLVLNYRLEGVNDWSVVATQSLDFLQNEANTSIPETSFDWNTEGVTSGAYELMVNAYGEGRVSYSNTISVTIDRIRPQVLGFPSPSDQILDDGEVIGVSFTEAIKQEKLQVALSRTSNGQEIDAFIAKTDNAIEILLDADLRNDWVGDSLRLTVDAIEDLAGNTAESSVSWTFVIDTEIVSISDLTLLGDGTVVNKASQNGQIEIVYREFDLVSSELDSIGFEYKPRTSDHWLPFDQISRTDLVTSMADMQDPQGVVIWDPSLVADGVYELRGLVYGFNGQIKYSNTIAIIVDRTSPSVISIHPSDSSYEFGDPIAIDFNEELDCLRGFSYEVIAFNGTQVGLFDELAGICDGNGSLIFGPNNVALHDQVGKTIQITITEAYDKYGNELEREEVISFVVGSFFLETSPISVQSPGNEWLINGVDSELEVVLGDYDITSSNYALDSVSLQFSPTFEDDWKTIRTIPYDELKDRYLTLGEVSYPITWNPADGAVNSGFYALRAAAYGNGGVPRYSEPILGQLDTVSPDLDNVIEDSSRVTLVFDELLSEDFTEATIQFNQMVNGISSESTGRVSETQDALNKYGKIADTYYEWDVDGKEMWVNMSDIMRSEYQGEQVELFVEGIKDHNGNKVKSRVRHKLDIAQLNDTLLLGSNLSGSYNGEGGIDLTWNYSGVIKSEAFVVERLMFNSFDSITIVSPRRDHTSYSFTDLYNFRDVVYYRLKYSTGSSDPVYSKIVRVDIDPSVAFIPKAMITPNPSEDRSQIKFAMLTRDAEESVIVRVFDSNGLRLAEKAFTPDEVSQTTLSVKFGNELTAGIYYVEITQGEHVEVQRAIIK